jgi:hypothetical protein
MIWRDIQLAIDRDRDKEFVKRILCKIILLYFLDFRKNTLDYATDKIIDLLFYKYDMKNFGYLASILFDYECSMSAKSLKLLEKRVAQIIPK